jgi:two-component system cell cycle response regulator PopA
VALTARVLILAMDDVLAEPLARGLDRLGWPSVTARGIHAALLAMSDFPIEAAIIVMTPDTAQDHDAALRLRVSRAPLRLPMLALGAPPRSDEGVYDLTLAAPLDPVQAAHRLEQLVRAAVAEEEFVLRSQTFAEHGRRLPMTEPENGPFRVLTIGEPAPKFLGLSHALKSNGAEVTAAFTAYTAFDYLHDRAFDAVVLWGGETQTEALSIAAGMRRNTRLYHLPTLLYLRSSAQLDLSDAYRRGLSDVATADTPESATALRVIDLAKAYRREQAVRRALERARGSGLMDASTGLFTRELFAAHLARLSGAGHGRRRPLSVAVLRITNRPEILSARAGGWLDRALPQIGSMIGRLVRAEDTAACIAPDVYALALPGATESSALIAAERISAVIGCTAFQTAQGQPPFTVVFDIGAADVHPETGAARALERAAMMSLGRKAS